MDKKLLVLCDESPTIDEYGNRIDEKGNLIQRDTFEKYEQESIMDKHKEVISILDLYVDIETKSTQNRDIFFVDWKTLIPEDLEFMQNIKQYGTIGGSNMDFVQLMKQQMSHNQLSLLERTALDSISQQSQPRIDFPLIAMNCFLENFTSVLQKSRIGTILPTFSQKVQSQQCENRRKILKTWNDRNRTLLQANQLTINNKTKCNVLPIMEYQDFGEIYKKAQEEMLKIFELPEGIEF